MSRLHFEGPRLDWLVLLASWFDHNRNTMRRQAPARLPTTGQPWSPRLPVVGLLLSRHRSIALSYPGCIVTKSDLIRLTRWKRQPAKNSHYLKLSKRTCMGAGLTGFKPE